MARRKVIYDGKAKTIYEGPEPGTYIQYFKDDATAFNKKKHEIVSGKGVLNNRISAHLMTKLSQIGIPTHFIKCINMREQLVQQVEIIPIEFVIRNIAAGSLAKRLGIPEGTLLPRPIMEYYYKKDELEDPMVNEEHLMAFGWCDPYELDEIIGMTRRINDYLTGMFAGIGLTLVDFKLEFGRVWGEQDELYILLADEISPDNCRLWRTDTGEKMDKDRFRHNLGDLVEGYAYIAEKLGLAKGGVIEDGQIDESALAQLETIDNEQAKARRMHGIIRNPSNRPKKA